MLIRIKKYDNFYVDTSLLNELDFEQIYNEKLIDKIVFGSDMPKHNSIEPTEFFKFFIENKKGLSEEDYNKLIYLNAKKVFDIKI